jgi:hypothetical protein
MKKRNLAKLSLNKKQISILHNLKGGVVGQGTDCAGTCSCECSNASCNEVKSECIACVSKK